jgi:O-antigen ligase
MLIRALVAGAIFALAVDHGTYGLTARHSLAIAVWWTLLVAVGLDLLPRAARYRLALLPAAPLAAFALITLASAGWAESVERAVLEFDRVALYLGVFLLVALAARRETLAQWTDGLAVGITAVAFLALISRCFPGLDLASPIHGFLPGTEDRLSFPLDYWNGLAIMSALAVPLLLRIAAVAPPPAAAAAVFAFPALGATIYMTSSRGGVAAAVVATLAFVALSRSWPVFAAACAAGLGAAIGVSIVADRSTLVNDPFSSGAGEQGRVAFVLLMAVGAALAVGWFAVSRFAPRPAIPRSVGWALAGLFALVAIAAAVALDPAERLESFKQPPSQSALPEDEFVRGHLLSATGSGRWQFWETAIDQFRDAPVVGQGAGSFEAWWAAHRTIAHFVRDAHSLYLEVLGELGLIGFAALILFIGLAAVVAARGLLAHGVGERGAAAAAAAAGLAYLCAAGIDWMWELTAVSVAGIGCVALACAGTNEGARRPVRATREALGARAALLVASWILICAEAVPLLSEVKIRDSQAAARRGDGEAALEDAIAARNIAPWSSSPYLQLGLVEEQAGSLIAASARLADAIERDPTDWRLRVVAARIDARRGAIAVARAQLAEARRLNPRSPIFRSGT